MKHRNFFLVALMCALMFVCSSAAYANEGTSASEYGYDSRAAVEYAKEHVNDGVGVCDEFVKACLLAGGVDMRAGGVKPLKDALVQAGFGTLHTMSLAADGVYINAQDNPTVKAGDVMFFTCKDCGKDIHTVIVSGFDENGNVTTYGHNPPWDNVSDFGRLKFTTDDGVVHTNMSYSFISMDTTKISHQHVFKEQDDQGAYYYDKDHPHAMYAKCDICEVSYYLGWNAKVSSCTDCNPPVSDKPIIKAEVTEAKAILVSWTPIEDVVNYELYRAKTVDGKYFKISTTEGTRITNKSVEPNLTYYYKVLAVREEGKESVWSDVVSARVETAEEVVETVTPTVYNDEKTGRPRLTWEKLDTVEKYKVYRSTNEAGPYTNVFTTGGNTYTHASASFGKTYYYRVSTINYDGEESELSAPVSAVRKCEKMVLTTGYNATSGKPRMTWTSVEGAKQYKVYRSESVNGVYKLAFTTTGTAFTNASVEAGKTYYYKAVAISKHGEDANSVESDVVSITAKTASVPVLSDMGRQESGRPRVKWTKVTDAVKYEVYRSESGKNNFTKVYTTKNISYTNTGAKGGTLYEYKVRAVLADGSKSSFSNVVKVISYCKRPTIKVIENTTNKKPRVMWNAVDGAEKYIVYRSTSENGEYVKMYTTKYTSYTNTSAVSGKTYYYKVIAVAGDASANSMYSNIVGIVAK